VKVSQERVHSVMAWVALTLGMVAFSQGLSFGRYSVHAGVDRLLDLHALLIGGAGGGILLLASVIIVLLRRIRRLEDALTQAGKIGG